MKSASELQIGDVLNMKLLDDKKLVQRQVVRVTPRTALTQIRTQVKANPSTKEIFELRSGFQVITVN